MLNSTQKLALLNDYGVSYYFYYIQPVFACMSTLLNLINTIVFSCKELRKSDSFFQYSLVNSVGATLFSLISIFMFVNKCGGSICSASTSYWAQIYIIYAFYYVCSSYYFGSAFVQIVIETKIYLLVTRKVKWLNNYSPYLVCSVIFGAWCLISIIFILTYEIDTLTVTKTVLESKNNKSECVTINQTLFYSHMTKNAGLRLTTTLIASIGNYVLLIILLVLNGLVYYELRKALERRKKVFLRWSNIVFSSVAIQRTGVNFPSILSFTNPTNRLNAISPSIKSQVLNKESHDRSLRRSFVMCLWISIIFSIDRSIKAVYRTVLFFLPFSPVTFYLNAICYLSGMIAFSSFFFVYMKTNRMFRSKFYKIFLRRSNE